MPSPTFAALTTSSRATPLAECDTRLARLHASRERWLAVDLTQRVAYLEQCLSAVHEVAPRWVADLCRVKGLDPETPLAGEEWIAGPAVTLRNIRLLLAALRAEAQPKLPGVSTRPNGQKVVRVVPAGLLDRLMFGGVTGEVWLEPGREASQGRIYREPKARSGKVALVLGAGNVSSIPPLDALHKLFVENEVVILKMNPVNEACGPHLEKAFACLIEAGFLEVVYGGGDVGAHLASHPLVDTLHVTGSNRTYDAIVWGAGPEQQAARKARGEPLNRRPFTAELGAVTPVLVVPGAWTPKQLAFQARHVAAMVTQNASFNCNAGKVLVVARDWSLREAFLEAVHGALAQATPRKAYYPGAEQRYRAFLEQYPTARALGQAGPEILPWTIIPDVPPSAGQYALTNEAFCGVLAEVSLPVASAADFLAAAVPFANDKCFGTLSCVVMVDEQSQRELAPELDAALEALRYGGIGINTWPGLIYALGATTWGAFPGHTQADIGSGTGVVHNTFLLDHPQKCVVRSPFMPPLTPAYFSDHRTLDALGRALVDVEGKAGAGALLRLAFAAVRG